MTRWLVVLLGIVALTALIVVCTSSRAPRIEADIRDCIAGRLDDAGLTGVEVTVAGRDASLAGNVADESRRRQAAAAASRDCGARQVTDLLKIVALPPYEASLCVDGRAARLRGNVPTPALRDAALTWAHDEFGAGADVELVVRIDAPEGFDVLFPLALDEMPQLESGCITLAGKMLSVAGLVRSDAARDRLTEVFDKAGRGLYTRNFNLAVPQKSAAALSCETFFAEQLDAGADVLFEIDSARLNAAGQSVLDRLVDRVRTCSRYRLLVTGHTDADGDAGHNRELSLRRAQAVVDYFAGNGVDPARLTAIGYGATQPRASNATEAGKARNRRIEIRVQETP